MHTHTHNPLTPPHTPHLDYSPDDPMRLCVCVCFRVRSTRSRAQSPCSPGQYPTSPHRQRAPTPGNDDRGQTEVKGHGTLERKSTKPETSEKKIPKSTSRELTAGKGTVCMCESAFYIHKLTSNGRSHFLTLSSCTWRHRSGGRQLIQIFSYISTHT